ncbi:hypothetical protein C8R47DRAFT_996313 [Mycena vitilis]|nr:hypothetical protein C8R47DRAFT_996313 [Mycena vitilis]
MARRGRLEAMLNDLHSQTNESDVIGKLAQILQPTESDLKNPLIPLTGYEVAQILAKGKSIPPNEYAMLLAFLHTIGQPNWRSYIALPHMDDELVLPPTGMTPSEVKLDGMTFSCKISHEGNSGIQFKNPGNLTEILTGHIDRIWQIPLQGCMQTFFVVQKHTVIPLFVRQRTPFPSMPHFETTVVDAAPSGQFIIIGPEHILTHLVADKRPKGTFGIETRDLLVICWSLNRGRRS